MNPHTPHPDEGQTPQTGPSGHRRTPNRRIRGAPGQRSRPGNSHRPPPPAGGGAPSRPGSRGPATRPGPGAAAPSGRAHPAGRNAAPAYAGGARPPQAGAQPQNFFDWIRSQGIHRGRDRWIGGVASGIAQRLGVDPLIVRGVLIVLTLFAGIGVLLYGLAWALLPEPDGRIHVQEAARRPVDHRHDRRADHHDHRLPRPGQRRLGLGPRRLRRLRLDGFLGGRRDLPRLLPDPTQQGPERGHRPWPRVRPAARRPGACGTPASAGAQRPPSRSPPSRAAARRPRCRHGPTAVRRAPVPGSGGYGSGRCGPGGRPAVPVRPATRAGAPAPAGQAAQPWPRHSGRGHHRRLALLVGRRPQGPRRRQRDRPRRLRQRPGLGQSARPSWASASCLPACGAGPRGSSASSPSWPCSSAASSTWFRTATGSASRTPTGPRPASSRPAAASRSPAGRGTVDLTKLALTPPLGSDVVVPLDVDRQQRDRRHPATPCPCRSRRT